MVNTEGKNECVTAVFFVITGDEVSDFKRFMQMARENRVRWAQLKPLVGRPIRMEPSTYATPAHRSIFHE